MQFAASVRTDENLNRPIQCYQSEVLLVLWLYSYHE